VPLFTLPELQYDYAALEPHISGRIMALHHDKHHAAYVDGANQALEQLEEARAQQNFSRIAALQSALAFHLSGHVLHSLFWRNMAPRSGGRPEGELARTIDRDFGSFELFRAQLTAAASTIMGSGWAALVWEPLSQRLITVQIYDHQSNVNLGGLPLLVLDTWEHAYYTQYENRKTDYFEAVWNVWNWQDVGERFEAVRHLNIVVSNAVG
jgi:Fe-Mn family superoxide dismutase